MSEMRPGARYTLSTTLVAIAVVAAGWAIPSASPVGVWAGAVVALVTQIAVFWGLFEWLLPERRMLAHGLGMIGRLVVFALFALLALRWPLELAASALFALVAVFFVSTVLEPWFLRTETLKRS